MWQGKNLNGFYKNHYYSIIEEFDNFEFNSDGSFIANKWNHEMQHHPERGGKYEISDGANDSIVFRFDDGRKDEYQVIFDRKEAYLYKDGKLVLDLLSTDRDCGY